MAFDALLDHLQQSEYDQLRNLLPPADRRKLSPEATSLDFDLFGFCTDKLNPADPGNVVNTSPSKPKLANSSSKDATYNGIIIGEATTGMMPSYQELQAVLANHPSLLDLKNFLSNPNSPPILVLKIRSFIAKLLQLERQAAFINLQYPKHLSVAALIDPAFRQAKNPQVDRMKQLIFSYWGKNLPNLAALHARQCFLMIAGPLEL